MEITADTTACRRTCPALDAGVHLRPRSAPPTGNSLSAVRVRGRRAVVKDVGVRPPNDGQAAADDARPRPPEDATPAAVHVVRVDPQRFVLTSCTLRTPKICHHFAVAFPSAASRARPCRPAPRCSLGYEPTT